MHVRLLSSNSSSPPALPQGQGPALRSQGASLGQRAAAVDVGKVQAQGALVAGVGHLQHPARRQVGCNMGRINWGSTVDWHGKRVETREACAPALASSTAV